MNRRKEGAYYENLVAEYLKTQGYEILEKNYRCRIGEIDLIARDGEYLVFVEVKYRTTGVSGYPAEAVDARKQQTIAKCAMHFLMKQGNDDVPCRFDVVAIAGAEGQEEITLYKDAFTLM